MKRLSTDQAYDREEMRQLQKYEQLFESYLNEYHTIIKELNELKENDKQKTLRYKENFGRKLFLSFFLEKAVKVGLLEKEDLG